MSSKSAMPKRESGSMPAFKFIFWSLVKIIAAVGLFWVAQILVKAPEEFQELANIAIHLLQATAIALGSVSKHLNMPI